MHFSTHLSDLALKYLQAKYERQAPRDQECVKGFIPGMVVALTYKRAQERRHA